MYKQRQYIMQTQIQKWGNSLAIRIPKSFSKETGIDNGSTIDLFINNGNIVIKPVQQKTYSLNELLKKINEQNIHSEIDTGDHVGGEGW